MNKKIDAFLDWFASVDIPALCLILFLGMAAGVWLATCAPGCDSQAVPVFVDGGAYDLVRIQESVPAPAPGTGGSVPIDFYPLQCQWDACGGPPPDRVREERP